MDHISVLDFDANANDGSADATAALQDAVAAAGGTPVFLPMGNYKLTAPITSSVPVNIYGVGTGAGPGAAVQSNDNVTQLMLYHPGNAFEVTTRFPSIFHDFQVNAFPSYRPHAGAGIYLAGDGNAHVANYKIENVSFTNVGTPIRILRPVSGTIRGNYFNMWNSAGSGAIHLQTSSGVEGGGGFIDGNYFDAPYTTVAPAIHSEVGYVWIDRNVILGGYRGIHFDIKHRDCGHLSVTNNQIENYGAYGIYVSSNDGSQVKHVSFIGNEFSDIEAGNNPYAAICIIDYPANPNWVNNVTISKNHSRSNTAAGGRHWWIGAGKNVIISENIAEELGSNNPQGLTLGGYATHAGIIAPFKVRDNTFLGIAPASRYSLGNNVPVIIDRVGMPFSALPACGNGSEIYVTDGTFANPVAGGGTGCIAKRINGVWRGD